MSENSAFWDGVAVGDAASITGWKAKYTSANMSDILSKLISNDSVYGYTIPGQGSMLNVTSNSPDDMSVLVGTGKAFINGRIYINTAEKELTISPNASGNPRLDRVILQLNYAAQTIRCIILEGTAANPPLLPALTQDPAVFEISLAYVWVAAAASSIGDTDIHDERVFLQTFASVNNSFGAGNEVYNSEFMSGRVAGTAPYGPIGWANDLYTALTNDTAPSQMTRGISMKLTGAVATTTGLTHSIFVKANTTYALKVLLKVDIGSVGYVSLTTNSLAPSTVTRTIQRDEWVEETIYYTTEYDATIMTLSIYPRNLVGEMMYVGQALIVEGYHPGPFRQIHETLHSYYTHLYLISEALYSTGTDTYSLAGTFAGKFFPGTKGLYFHLRSQDSDITNAVGSYVKVYGGSDVWFSSTSHDVLFYGQYACGEIALIDDQFDVEHVASGAATLKETIYVYGLQT